MNIWLRSALVLSLASAALSFSNAEAQNNDAAAELAAEREQRLAYVRAMHVFAADCKVLRLTDAGEVDCEMTKQSVLNWSDPARHADLLIPGTCWIWHDRGRPQVIGEIYGRDNAVGTWNLYACSLSSDPVRFTSESRRWSATASYYAPQAIPNSTVATTTAARTLQLNQLARRFDSHQFWEEQRYELRLLPQAIYRYEDEKAGIVDGAIYALVHGTNPEVLLLIEAHATNGSAAQWKVAFGSLAGARCVVRLDGKQIWDCPLHQGDPADPRQGFYRDVRVE